MLQAMDQFAQPQRAGNQHGFYAAQMTMQQEAYWRQQMARLSPAELNALIAQQLHHAQQQMTAASAPELPMAVAQQQMVASQRQVMAQTPMLAPAPELSMALAPQAAMTPAPPQRPRMTQQQALALQQRQVMAQELPMTMAPQAAMTTPRPRRPRMTPPQRQVLAPAPELPIAQPPTASPQLPAAVPARPLVQIKQEFDPEELAIVHENFFAVQKRRIDLFREQNALAEAEHQYNLLEIHKKRLTSEKNAAKSRRQIAKLERELAAGSAQDSAPAEQGGRGRRGRGSGPQSTPRQRKRAAPSQAIDPIAQQINADRLLAQSNPRRTRQSAKFEAEMTRARARANLVAAPEPYDPLGQLLVPLQHVEPEPMEPMDFHEPMEPMEPEIVDENLEEEELEEEM